MKTQALLTILITASFVPTDQPETTDGMMVVDEVLVSLRQNAVEKDPQKKLDRLRKVAKTRDPRVAVALEELIGGGNRVEISFGALRVLVENYTEFIGNEKKDEMANERLLASRYRRWYIAEYPNIQRRAKSLPH